MMSIINSIIALLIVAILCNTVKNAVYIEKELCECQPSISKLGKGFIVCFKGCDVKPVNSKLYNTTCSHMNEITITVCKGNRYVTSLPTATIHEEYTITSIIHKIWKVVITITVWLIFIILKVPILCLLSVGNQVFNGLMKSKLRECGTCKTKYSVSHVDCPTPSFKLRTDYNLFFYIFLTMLIFVTLAKADDNEFNFYHHGNQTEVQILDKEHYKQDIDVQGYLYTVTVLNSHLEIQTINVSEILIPTKHILTHEHFSCDGSEGCQKECQASTGFMPMYYVKKAYDGFSCLFTSATLCGLCKSEMKTIGYKVTTTKVSPYIDIEVVHGNKTEMIKIRDFSKFIHEPYYVKPIEPVWVESVDMFVTGTDVYVGQICNMPSYGCFGPNYKKDNKTFVISAPKVRDPMTHDRELILEHCVDPGNSDINSLQKTQSIYHDGVIIRPYEFGMLSIGFPIVGKLIGDFCEKPAEVTKILVNGCFDCQSGLEAKISYKLTERCGKIVCYFGQVKYEYFVDHDYNDMSIHTCYDKKNIIIKCNDFSNTFVLDHNKDTNYYGTSNEVHGSADIEFNILKHLPNLLFNPKVVVTTLLVIAMTIYMAYCISKQLYKHYVKIKVDRAIRYHKKTDTIIDESANEFIVVTGSAQ
uniref:Glycoprotein n=1 Tax=Emaravirus fici TaxID=1980427 RepID=A0A481XSU5_9VIRU|nr:glycoprotein precursor [Emaravirus fici]